MFDHQVNLLDLGNIFDSLGTIALRSMRGWSVETADLSEWLCLTENEKLTQFNQFPDCYFKDLLFMIYSPHDHISWDAIYPTFDQLVTHVWDRNTEIGDLLMVTTILLPLIEKTGVCCTVDPILDIQNDPPNELIPQIILQWDQKCILTLDSVTRSLIPSIAYIASKLEMKIDRAKKRKTGRPQIGALGPTMRIRYETLRHVPRDKILDRLRRVITPIYDLADLIGDQPCVFWGRNGPQHAKLTQACELMTLNLQGTEGAGVTRITDQYNFVVNRW